MGKESWDDKRILIKSKKIRKSENEKMREKEGKIEIK